MPHGKGYERMLELTASIERALRELEAGHLDAEGVERCTDEARALFERLVVLRHKAREAALAASGAASAVPPMRLDTRPPEPPTRQTSLIDAIAETEAKVPAHKADAPKPAPSPKAAAGKAPSVADRLEHAPVADLHKAIALSQKFWFVAELFSGQRDAYEKAVDTINACGTAEQAKAFIDREVLAKLPKPPGEDVLTTFLELVQRRFQ